MANKKYREQGYIFAFCKRSKQGFEKGDSIFFTVGQKKYIFPKKLNVYITDEAYVLTFIEKEQVTASIFFPDSERENPLIRVSTGDYSSMLIEDGRFVAVCSILASIAHEITHYYQWLRDVNCSFNEEQARRKAVRVVYRYLDDKR